MSNYYQNWMELVYQDTATFGQKIYLGNDPENPNAPSHITHTVKGEFGNKGDSKKIPYIEVDGDKSARIEPSKNNFAVALRLCKAGIFKVANGGPFHEKFPSDFIQVVEGQGAIETENVDDIVNQYIDKEGKKAGKQNDDVDEEENPEFSLEDFIKDVISEGGNDVGLWKIDQLRAVNAKLELGCSGQSKDAYIPKVEQALIEKGFIVKEESTKE